MFFAAFCTSAEAKRCIELSKTLCALIAAMHIIVTQDLSEVDGLRRIVAISQNFILAAQA